MRQYYFLSGQQQYGPFSKEQLLENGLSTFSLVWCEGMADWRLASEVEDLKDLFQPISPQIPKNEERSVPHPLQNEQTIMLEKQDARANTEKKSNKKYFVIAGVVIAVIIGIVAILNEQTPTTYQGNNNNNGYSSSSTETSLQLHSSVSQATKIRSNSVILNGTLFSKSNEVLSYSFEYTRNGYTEEIPAKLIGDKFSVEIKNLYPNTTYEFCIAEKQNQGTIRTSTMSFTTLQSPTEIKAKVTTHSGKLFSVLSQYNAKKKKIIAACDYRSNTVRSKAAELASQTEGNFNIGQVCDIFDYCYDNWKYVNDPNRGDLYQKASNTIRNGLTGDCDDFAILMASMLLAIGGDARVNVAYTSESGHAYTELNVGKTDIKIFADYIRARYGFDGSIWYRTDSNNNNWLNLDWQAKHPGGEYYGGKRGARIYIIDEFVEEFSYR